MAQKSSTEVSNTFVVYCDMSIPFCPVLYLHFPHPTPVLLSSNGTPVRTVRSTDSYVGWAHEPIQARGSKPKSWSRFSIRYVKMGDRVIAGCSKLNDTNVLIPPNILHLRCQPAFSVRGAAARLNRKGTNRSGGLGRGRSQRSSAAKLLNDRRCLV